mmetsp:Transcript_3237/g.4926  ORF Transcript_3237/g.4926 Transcript_3237/m.4926 type:complete len:90 (-) Transcript_3237:2675-2944(-)
MRLKLLLFQLKALDFLLSDKMLPVFRRELVQIDLFEQLLAVLSLDEQVSRLSLRLLAHLSLQILQLSLQVGLRFFLGGSRLLLSLIIES